MVRNRLEIIFIMLVIVAGLWISHKTQLAHAAGNIYYVAISGNDSNIGSASQPFRTIARAYSLTLPGDTIIVKPGTYTEYSNNYSGITLDRSGTASSPITIKSEVKGQAILDAQSNSARYIVVTFYGNYNILDGFVITNSYGGGLNVVGSNNTAINNEISYNGQYGDPASPNGHDGVDSDPASRGTQYIGNYIHNNGRVNLPNNNLDHGMYLDGDNELIANNIISNNLVMGLQIAGYDTVSNMQVYNNTIANNGKAGIILWQAIDNIQIKNNIILNNGAYGIGSYNAHGSGVVIDHNLIYGNYGNFDPTSLSDFTYTYTNTISNNPQFVSSSDFHLQSSSPAIDAGLTISSVPTDFDGNSRPVGPAYDIGAYEYGGVSTTTPPPPPPPGCISSSSTWQNSSINSQTGSFTIEFDATASVNATNAPIGLSNGPASDYTNLGPIIRFNPNNMIDARNGANYTAQANFSYTPGITYHVRLLINTTNHTYSAFVKPSGSSSEITIASSYAFRSEQSAVTTLNNLGFIAVGSTVTVCDIAITNTTPISGDLNLDHIVNSLDWSIMNSKWFTTDANADLNHDGLVNAIDFSILNANWFKTW